MAWLYPFFVIWTAAVSVTVTVIVMQRRARTEMWRVGDQMPPIAMAPPAHQPMPPAAMAIALRLPTNRDEWEDVETRQNQPATRAPDMPTLRVFVPQSG